MTQLAMKRAVKKRRSPRRGISLVEVTISTLIVGLMMVSALKSFGHITTGRNESADEVRAKQLCRQMLAEVLATDYEEPVDTPLFGRETGEAPASRTNWDDVDDFHGLSNSPPSDIADWALAGFSADWRREVTVDFVTPADPSVVSGSDQGLKRITVTVRKNGTIVAEIVALRSDKY